MTTHPVTRTEALAAGLKVYAWGAYCTKCQTQDKYVRTGKCVTCETRHREALKERDKRTAERVRREVLKTARAQVLRELKAKERHRLREEAQALKAAEKAARSKAREAAKRAAAREKARATKAAAQEQEGPSKAPRKPARCPHGSRLQGGL